MSPKPRQSHRTPTNRWEQRLIDLDVHWLLSFDESRGHRFTSGALKERVKDLNCLYALSQLVEKGDSSFDDFLAMVVDILPPSWQFPEIACARIVLEDRCYDSLCFQSSAWHLSSPLHILGAPAGEVTVYYTEARPEADEGPFLREERHLLDAVAERLGRIASRKLAESRLAEANRQLAIEEAALRETNTALRAVLARNEVEKTEIQRNILENVEKILMPIVHELTIAVPPEHKDCLALLRDNLEQITSPFTRQLSLAFQSLTATELRICGMIRTGMKSKEIAQLRGVSPATISRHRESIRRKLGIANAKVNLETYLQGTA